MARKIVIACQGTRGDVQPYVALGIKLTQLGWHVVLGAPPEFKAFVTGYGLQFADLGDSPTHVMYKNAVASDKRGPIASYQQAVDMFNPSEKDPFTLAWFRRIFTLVKTQKPDILMLVFTSWSGAGCIPQLLGLNTKVIISYPMPMTPTGEFSVTMAGTGLTLPFAFLNRLQWRVSERWIVKRIHAKAAQRNVEIIIQEEAAAGRPLPGALAVDMDTLLDPFSTPAIFCYSPALLPKPADWPANHHVIGQLKIPKLPNEEHKPLPRKLQDALDKWRKEGQHVVYFGFGSLSFFEPAVVSKVFDSVAAAVTQLAITIPVRGVIQTTLSSTPGKTGNVSSMLNIPSAPFVCFSESVDHSLLFPQVSIVMSHGGVGTVQAALGAGKPVISMCCLPTADQSFWADLAYRKELGPKYFWVDDVSTEKVLEVVRHGLVNIEKYTTNAEAMAKEIALENGVTRAIEILEQELATIVVEGQSGREGKVAVGENKAVKCLCTI